eukprot:15326795-Ditylum_brightwellii.AAC.1
MDTGTEDINKDEKESVMEKIKAQGVKAIDAAKTFITAAAIDFVVLTNATSYPIRNEFVNLLRSMKNIESPLTIKATKGDDQWTVPDSIPSGDEFTRQFSVRTESTKRGSAKIVAHCTLSSKQWLNNIKWHPQMISFLKHKNIFINFD